MNLRYEYLYYKNQSNKYIYNYRYFDIYFKESIKIFNTPLDNRIQLMNELHNILNSDEIIKYIDPNMFISCQQKEYYNISEINTIMNINKYPYHIDGIICAASNGVPGSTYCIGGNCEKTNLDLVNLICNQLDNLFPSYKPHSKLIKFVEDRPGHDFRYSIDSS